MQRRLLDFDILGKCTLAGKISLQIYLKSFPVTVALVELFNERKKVFLHICVYYNL